MSAYVIVNNRVTDPDGMAEYVPKALATLAPYEPEIIVLEDEVEVLEGTSEFPRLVIIKFKSREDAEAWYNSSEYSDVLALRLASTEGVAFMVDHFVPPAA